MVLGVGVFGSPPTIWNVTVDRCSSLGLHVKQKHPSTPPFSITTTSPPPPWTHRVKLIPSASLFFRSAKMAALTGPVPANQAASENSLFRVCLNMFLERCGRNSTSLSVRVVKWWPGGAVGSTA